MTYEEVQASHGLSLTIQGLGFRGFRVGFGVRALGLGVKGL